MYNQAVPDLPCSQCTIRQFPTSSSQCTIRQFPTSHVLSVQSGSSRPPMFSMYNQVCSHHVPNVRSPLSPMWNTYMSLKHPANHPSPVLSPSLSNTSMKLGALAQHLRKKKTKICNLPMYKNRVLPPRPRILRCSSAVPSPLVVTQVTQCIGCKFVIHACFNINIY